MNNRQMPNNIEAEQAVLGSVFIDQNKLNVVIDRLQAEDFFKRSHQLIFKAMHDLFNNNLQIDYTTLKDNLSKSNHLVEAGGIEYLSDLSLAVPSTANLESYINIVKDKSMIRKIIEISTRTMEEGLSGKQSANEFIDNAEKSLFEVTKDRRTGEFRQIAPVIDEVIKTIEQNSESTGSVTGYQTGYKPMDNITFGLQKEDLMILAARPGVGKTAFALNLATNMAKLNNLAVAIFSMEMSAEQLVSRILSRESGVPSEQFKTGSLTNNDWASVQAATEVLKRQRIFFDDGSGTNVNELRAKCRKLNQEGNLDFIVIDYLQLMSGGGHFSGNRQQEVSYISRTLKEVARELKVPVLALSQLSRQLESREDKRPKMSDLRESGSIEQDADIVMFLYREDYHSKDADRPDITELNFAKNRHGSNGVIEFKFEKECTQFNSVAPSYVDNNMPDMPDMDDFYDNIPIIE